MTENNNTVPEILSVRTENDKVTLELYVSEQLSYFSGHFPGAPILPGVVQLDWAVKYACEYLHMPTNVVHQVEVLKYQMVIKPDSKIELVLEQKSASKFTFALLSQSGTHASGRVIVKD
ncbi:ApeI family dehydratase [Thalassotalea litorea]|uniref:ApeI family dehydratase n=1 Tax=Thalassotalea litorea TaxID=2020715 RepID=UPI0037368F67